MVKSLSVLNVEDTENDSKLVTRLLKKAGYKLNIERVETAVQMRSALNEQAWDIIIADCSLPQFTGYAALQVLHEMQIDIPFIAISGTLHEEEVVGMMKAGAHDYLMKDNLTRLVPAVERELQYAEVRRERRQVQEKLLESELRFRQVWETTSDAMVLSDPEGIVLAVNPAYSNLCGYLPEEVIGSSFTIIFPHVNQSSAIKQYKDLFISDKIPPAFESVIKRADGTERNTESKIAFITKAGTRIAMLSTIRDITERKKADDLIRTSEKHFRALIENSLDDISLLNAEGTLVWESPSVTRNLDYASNEFVGRKMFELMHPDDLKRTQILFAKLVQKPGSRQSGSFRLKHSDGTWRWVEAIATNLLNEPGIEAIVINYRDITSRKNIEDALRRKEMVLAQAGKMAHLGAWELELGEVKNISDNPLHWSDEIYRIFGYEPGTVEVTNDLFFSHVHPDDRQKVRDAVSQALVEKRPYEIEHRLIRADGNERIVLEHADITFDDNGQPLRMLGAIQDITERKLAEKFLSSSEARYRSLFEDSPIALWEENFSAIKKYIDALREQGVINFDEYFRLHPQAVMECASLGKVLDVNNAAIKLVQANKKDDLLKSLAELSKDEPIDQLRNELVQIAEGRTVFGWEGIIKTLDGRQRNIDLSWRAVPDLENSLSRVIVSMIDITERKQMEAALMQSEQAHRTLFENVPVGLYRTAANGQMLDANPALVKLFGYEDRESLLAVKAEDLYADPATNEKFNDEIARSDLITNLESEFRKEDGTTFWAEDHIQIIRDEDGKPLFYEGSLIDITERKLSEKARHESEERFHSLFNRMMDGVYRSTHEGNFIDINPAMVKMFGYSSKEEMLNIDIKNELYFQAQERGSHVLDTGKEEMDVYRMRRKDGSEIWVEDHGSYIHDEHGKIIYHEGILRDITERKHTNQLLAESEERFRQAIIAADAIPYSLNYASDHYTFMGEGITKLAGYSLEQITPALLDSIIVESVVHGRFAGMELSEAVKLIREGKNGVFWRCDHRIRTRSGEERWISDASIQVLDKNGKPEGSIGIIQNITERKQTEAAAREGEARYRGLFEDSPVSLWEEDFSAVKLRLDQLVQDGVKDFRAYFKTHPQVVREYAGLVKIINVNKATLKLFGAKSKDDLGEDLSHIFSTEIMELFENELISLAQGRTQFEWEGINQTLDGRQLIVHLSLSVIPGYEDTLSKVIISMVDITARMQAEKTIRESEKSLRESQELAGLGSYVLDFKKGTWKGSEIFDRLIGIDQTYERTMTSWPLILHTDDRQPIIENLEKEVIGKRMRLDEEFRIIRMNDQVERWMHAVGEAEFDSEGQPIKIQGTMQDITERKQVEESLRHSENRYLLASKATNDVIWEWNLETDQLYWNENVQFIFGYLPDEINLHETWWQNHIHPEDQKRISQETKSRIARGESIWTDEYRFQRKDGSYAYIVDRGYVERDSNGKALRMIGAMSDITARKQAEIEIKERTDDMELIALLNEAINRGESLNHIFKLFAEKLSQISRCNEATFYLLSSDRKSLVMQNLDRSQNSIKKIEQLIGRQIPLIQIPIKDGNFFHRALQSEQGILTTDPETIQNWIKEFTETNYLPKAIRGTIHKLVPQIFNLLEIRSTIAIPLISDKKVIGLFDVSSTEILTDGDLDRMQKISAQLTAVILRKQAENELSKSEQRYRALFEDMPVPIWEEDFSDLKKHLDSLKEQGITDLRAYFESNPQAMLECDGMIKVLDLNQAALKMYQTESKEALLQSLDEGLSSGELDHLIDDFIAIADGKTNHSWEGADETLTGKPIEISLSWSVVPGHEADFSRVIVTTVDITERKKAEAESKYQLSELEALYENGLAISRLLDPKRIAQRMVQVIDQKLDWHHAAIRLYDAETDRIELLALNSPGFNDDQIAEQIERINQTINTPDKGLSGWVIRHGEIVRVAKLKDDPRYVETYTGIKSGLYVPITTGDQVIGSIAVESEQENAFTERDANTLMTLANQAAISFINARLYLWLQKELDERHRAEEQIRKLNIELEQRVTERTAQIEATKRRLELATHAGQIGVWEYNPRENKVIWDERMHEIHHIPIGEFDGTSQTWATLIHPDDIEQSQINRQLAVTKNLLMSNEHRIVWPNGSIRHIMTSAVTAYAPDGTPDRIIGINMDITERKQIEQSLRESETYARLLFDAVPDPVFVTKADGLIVDVNKVFEEQYAVSSAEIRGRHIYELDIYPETELVKQEKYLSEVLQGQTVNPVELDFYVPGDRIHTLEMHSYLLKDKERQLVLNTMHDITAHKKAEETQRIAKSEIERALRIKNEFLANMSHELRTPLNSILGISESLEEQIVGTLNEKQLKYIGIVRESGRHLLELINDILDLSKIEAGRMELDIHRISVETICQSSLRMIKELSQKKSINVSFMVKGDIQVVMADQRRLKQSLVNLLSNAVKFTPAGKEIGLEVSGNAETNEAEFIVWDQGVGIAQEDIKRLFKPFVQLDAGLAREYQGTGLGLALVSQMINLHGGRVSVQSELSEGSRFIITLPWLPTEQTRKAKVTGELILPVSKSDKKYNGRVLLVEDTDVVVQLISEYLRYKGYEVILANNGVEGVELAKKEHPDLILMDVMMPIMDGLEATQNIRKDKALQKTPIIALTALAMAGDSEKCLAAGMNDYLSKPIQMQNLADIIEKYLGSTKEENNEK